MLFLSFSALLPLSHLHRFVSADELAGQLSEGDMEWEFEVEDEEEQDLAALQVKLRAP